MPSITHLAAKSSSSAMEYTLKPAWVLAFMILLKFGAHLSYSALPFYLGELNISIAIDDFLRSL